MLAARCRSSVLTALCLALAGIATGGTARAQGQGPDYEAARRHYQAAAKAASAGDHAGAAREYAVAYDITKDPVLFFKIGQSFDKAGDCRSALVYYGRYLKEGKPSPEYRQRTEALMGACQNRPPGPASGAAGATSGSASGTGATSGSVTAPASGPGSVAGPGSVSSSGPASASGPVKGSGSMAGAATAAGSTAGSASGPGTVSAPESTPGSGAGPASGTRSASTAASDMAQDSELVGAPRPLDQEQPSWERTAAWTSVGVTLALGTTAAVLGLSAASREEDVQNLIDFRDTEGFPARYTGPTRDRYEDLVDEGERLEKLSAVALAATCATAAASVVFFVLDVKHGRTRRERAAPSSALGAAIGRGTAGLNWSGSF